MVIVAVALDLCVFLAEFLVFQALVAAAGLLDSTDPPVRMAQETEKMSDLVREPQR